MSTKLRYLADSTVRTLTRKNQACPSCGCTRSSVVARKYLMTALRRCWDCRLLFRAPTTPASDYDRYYQADYASGLTTSLPDDAQLRQYLADGFSGTEKDFSRYIDILYALGVKPEARVLDYGCSWGYGCWQLRQAGYDARGFELSEPRAAYGRDKLGLDIVSDADMIGGSFDVFFSTHVVEHVPGVAGLMSFAFRALAPGGLFVAVTPNGSLHYRERHPGNWSRVWGYKHPVVFDEVFLQQAFADRSHLATTRLRDLKLMTNWVSSEGSEIDDMTGWELLVVARPCASRPRAA